MTAIAEEIPPGEWMRSVAELLPVPHLAPQPFTLGEAVAELKLWAETARAESWRDGKNRRSLNLDIASGLNVLGPRLRSRVEDLLRGLDTEHDREAIAAACATFFEIWGTMDAISESFRDLCEAAASGAGVWDLRPLAEALVSQTGDTVRGWGVLNEAAVALEGDPHSLQIEHWLGEGSTAADLTPTVRLELAESVITSSRVAGNVVVWLLYRRALGLFTLSAGPITFFRMDWAIPNATRDDGQDFIYRDELRTLVSEHSWLVKDDLLGSTPDADRFVLARVDLGERSPAGASEEALRQVEALLSIAVGAGGVSWVYTGTSLTLVDGKDRISSFGGPRGGGKSEFHDTYGMRATADVLEHWAKELGPSLEAGPMPDFLVEALSAFRQATMIDHRDVSIYNERPITPRLATALEDHAIELVASLASTTPETLVAELEEQEVEDEAEQLILTALLAPIDRNRGANRDLAQSSEALEADVAEYSEGTRFVSLRKTWEARERLRSLPISPATRVTFEAALDAISSVAAEKELLARARAKVAIVRARHRRVRNAVTHGNPVTPAALEGVRSFSRRTSRAALSLALRSFGSRKPIATLLIENAGYRAAAAEQMKNGMSRLQREAAALAQSAQDEGA